MQVFKDVSFLFYVKDIITSFEVKKKPAIAEVEVGVISILMH